MVLWMTLCPTPVAAEQTRVPSADEETVVKPPPALPEQVMSQILVERDLDAAQKLLEDALAGALDQVSNPRWTARIYSLLSVVALYRGDQDRAERYAERALVLFPGVTLEPQLGDAPALLLARVAQGMARRDANARMVFPELPEDLAVYVDGVRWDTPRSQTMKPGEHLVQVAGTVGVVARKWVTLAPGQTLVEPPPIPEVLRVLGRPDTRGALPDEALLQSLARASEDASAVSATVAQLMNTLDQVLDTGNVPRAACVQAHLVEAGRLAEAVREFAGRLDTAARSGDQDEVAHLARMIAMARTQAESNLVDVEDCYDLMEPGAPPEVRVLEEPPPPPVSVDRVVVWGQPEAPFFWGAVPERWPRFDLVRSGETSLSREAAAWARSAAQNGGSGSTPGRPWVQAEIWTDLVADTNPDRLPGTAAANDFRDRAEVAAAWTPTLVAGGHTWFAGIRYPLRLGLRTAVASDLEAVVHVGQVDAPGRWVGADVQVRRDTYVPAQIGGALGAWHRLAARMDVRASLLPPAALALQVQVHAGGDRHLLMESLDPVERVQGGLAILASWNVFPRSHLRARLAWAREGLRDSASILYSGARRTRQAALADFELDGQISPALFLSARLGPQWTGVSTTPLESSNRVDTTDLVGSLTVASIFGPVRGWVRFERSVAPEPFADLGLTRRATLGMGTRGDGRFGCEVRLHAGRESYRVVDQGADSAALPDEWWPDQWVVGGTLAPRVSFRAWGRRVDARVLYAPVVRRGVPRLSEDAPASGLETDPVVVQQLFAGLRFGF